MANLEGMKMKFVVLKTEDLQTVFATHPHLRGQFDLVLQKIMELRNLIGKEDNKYLVVNTDEPYADKVINIMKENGHWG